MTETGNTTKGLASAFASAMSWNTIDLGLSQIVSLGVFVVLTYHLSPEVFGIFAISVLVLDYLTVEAKSAAIDVMVMRQNFDRETLSRDFWSIAPVFIGAAILMVLAAGPIARLTGLPELRLFVPVLCTLLLVSPFAIPPRAILMKRRDFRGPAQCSILANISGALAATAVALGPAPLWALVAQRLTSGLVEALYLGAYTRWFPGLSFNWNETRGFLSDTVKAFGAKSAAASLFRAVDVVLAAWFGAAAVGLMRVAERMFRAIVSLLAAPMGTLWMIMLSERQVDKTATKNLYLSLTSLAALILAPAFAGLAMISDRLVALALSDAYAGAADYFFIFALTGLLSPFYYFRNAGLTALKRLNTLVILSCLDIASFCAVAFLLRNFGPVTVISALFASRVISAVLFTRIITQMVGVSYGDVFRCVFAAYHAAGWMVAALLAVQSLAPTEQPSGWVHLLAFVGFGALVYLLALGVFHRVTVRRLYTQMRVS